MHRYLGLRMEGGMLLRIKCLRLHFCSYLKITVFWDVVPCSLVEGGRRFEGR
jgi:hypothetical protein